MHQHISKSASHCCPGKINATTKKFDNQICTDAFVAFGKCKPPL